MSYYRVTCPDELYHYGVLGMKWGMHKAARKGTEYTYKSHGTKKYEKKSARMDKKLAKTNLSERKRAKLERKKAIFERRAERSRTLDQREQAYAKRVRTGGNLAVRLLTGVRGVGSKPYQQYLAMQNTKGDIMADGKNVVKMGTALVASKLGGRLGSTAAKALYLRSGEREYLDEKKKG
jgi:hypothetical protein